MSDYRQNICYVSCLILVICVVFFLSNICKYQTHTDTTSSFPLQFVSTQMGACLVEYPIITWMFVWSITVQMLLLFHLFLLCCCHEGFKDSYFKDSYFEKFRKAYFFSDAATSCSLCTIGLISNIAAVAEFRSTSVSQSEKNAHYLSAVCVMASFWCIHILISMCLKDKNYMIGASVYFCIFLLLLVLMVSYFDSSGAQTGQLMHASIIIEWVLLFTALTIQLYAERTLQRKLKLALPSSGQQAAAIEPVKLRLRSLAIWFVFTVSITVFLTPPWFMEKNLLGSWHNQNKEYLQTGPEFWFLVIFGNCVIVLISKYSSC
jgi:hypothetical protein